MPRHVHVGERAADRPDRGPQRQQGGAAGLLSPIPTSNPNSQSLVLRWFQVQAARTFHRALAELAAGDGGCGANCSQAVDWIHEQLGALNRVDAYKQTFWDASAGVERANVYGILRASPLADGKVLGSEL